LSPPLPSPADLINRLGLEAHPEGGHFRETFRHRAVGGERGALTLIYYLLAAGQRSAWHRIDATEAWHYYAGDPLRLSICASDGIVRTVTLGTDFIQDQHAHAVVPAHAWQTAETVGRWTLVGCTVAPAFDFAGLELAPEGWSPPA
jgi:hypothetical protein